MTTVAISNSDFRAALGSFASGVTVITGLAGDRPRGLTCQSFFSLSLRPPLVAVALSTTSTSWPDIERSGAFCANVLTADQAEICHRFAMSGGDKFAGLEWSPGPTGSPRIRGSHAWIECAIQQVLPAGDHFLAIGAILDLEIGGGRPLLFYRGELDELTERATPGAESRGR